jgi:hypothetical protein
VAACQLPVLALVGGAAHAAAADGLDPRESADMPFRAAHAEVGAALRLSPAGAERRLEMARMISGRLPAVQAALSVGDLSYWHAKAIAGATEDLDDEKARRVAARVLPKARHQTVADLRRALRRAVLAVDPKSADQRHAKAKAERKLDWWDLPDGMAELRLVGAAADVKAAFNAADAFAAAVPKKDADGKRIPIDARRADALVAMVTGGSGGTPGARPATSVQVTVDLATLLGLRAAGTSLRPRPHLARDAATHEAAWTSPTGHTYRVPHHDHRCIQAHGADIAASDYDAASHLDEEAA